MGALTMSREMTSPNDGERAAEVNAVEEIQGVYGPFTVSEKLVQKIWLRGEFDPLEGRTEDGRRLRVRFGGKWNLLSGPDFKGAVLELDGERVEGEVEVHLHEREWDHHGHAGDPAYAGVVLHVVLFPGTKVWTAGVGGRKIPVFTLLPRLYHDLEAYASEEAVEGLAGRPVTRLRNLLEGLAPEEAAGVVRVEAKRRWEQKVRFARVRVERLGWEGACHQTALEVLGYRFNRAPMLRTAGRWGLAAWREGGKEVVEQAWEEEAGQWVKRGVRPANLPRKRLEQYAAWVAAVPDWPVRLGAAKWEEGAKVGEVDPAGVVRKVAGLGALRVRWREEVTGGVLSGPRFDTWVCDAVWPLLAAGPGVDGVGAWMAWWPGDQPADLQGYLRELGLTGGRERPASQGLFQGLLGWLIERDKRSGGGKAGG